MILNWNLHTRSFSCLVFFFFPDLFTPFLQDEQNDFVAFTIQTKISHWKKITNGNLTDLFLPLLLVGVSQIFLGGAFYDSSWYHLLQKEIKLNSHRHISLSPHPFSYSYSYDTCFDRNQDHLSISDGYNHLILISFRQGIKGTLILYQ